MKTQSEKVESGGDVCKMCDLYLNSGGFPQNSSVKKTTPDNSVFRHICMSGKGWGWKHRWIYHGAKLCQIL